MSSPPPQPPPAGDILLESSPGGVALRVTLPKLLSGAQDPSATPLGQQDARQPSTHGSPELPGSSRLPSEPQYDEEDVDFGGLEAADLPGGDAEPGSDAEPGGAAAAAAAAAADALARAAEVEERFPELLYSIGAEEALKCIESEYSAATAAELAQRIVDAATADLLEEESMDAAEWSSTDDGSTNKPGTAAYYRAQLTQPLYPDASITLLQYLTWLLRLRGSSKIPDEVSAKGYTRRVARGRPSCSWASELQLGSKAGGG